LNETGTSRAGARYGAAFVQPERNFDFIGSEAASKSKYN